MPAKKHIHKYERRKIGNGTLWTCALFNCNHHMPKHMEELMNRKASICWECELPFSLDAITMGNDRPVCKPCLGIESETDSYFSPTQIAIRTQERQKLLDQQTLDALKNKPQKSFETDSGLIINDNDDDDAMGVLKK